MSERPANAPKQFRSPDARANRTRRCIFLPEGRPIERNTWRCGCGDGDTRAWARVPAIRLVSSRKRAVVGRLIATLFIVGKHRLDNGVCCSSSRSLPSPSHIAARHGPSRFVTMTRGESPLGMLLTILARVFRIIKPFK